MASFDIPGSPSASFDKAAIVAYINSLPPQRKWWEGGKKFAFNFGWKEIYAYDGWTCIYCGKDLIEHEDIVATSTEEHLVPQSLFITSAEANTENNVVACCAGCNGLKGPAVPPPSDPAWNSRKEYIAGAREYIIKRRVDRITQYAQYVAVSKIKRLFPSPTNRLLDYV